MRSKLSWKNGVIFFKEKPIGDFVKDKMLSCQYKLNEMMLCFEEQDLYKRQIAIMDSDRKRVGMINRSRWTKRAKITLVDNREFELKPRSLLSNKYRLYADQNVLMEFNKGMFKKGEINYIFQDETLILAGLYVLTD